MKKLFFGHVDTNFSYLEFLEIIGEFKIENKPKLDST